MVSTATPRIVAYWKGAINQIQDPDDQPFNPSFETIPAYVHNIDLVILCFVLVKNGTIVHDCGETEECLCMGPERHGWTYEEIKQWVIRSRQHCPRLKFSLSIGGEKFCDWASVTSAEAFANNVVQYLETYWTVIENGTKTYLIDGIDIDYETYELVESAGAPTPLPDHVQIGDIFKQLALRFDQVSEEEAILSLPYFWVSPTSLEEALFPANQVTGLQDYLSFVSVMEYVSMEQSLQLCQQLISARYRPSLGFAFNFQTPEVIQSTIVAANATNPSFITSAMFWNICKLGGTDGTIAPFQYINTIHKALPQDLRILSYWDGTQKLTDPEARPFNPDVTLIPPYVQRLDAVLLGPVLVKNGRVQHTCAEGEQCLCMGNDRGGWTQAQIHQWIQRVHQVYPNVKFLLSIGGPQFSDWASVTNEETFSRSMVDYIQTDWSVKTDQGTTCLVSGVYLDYQVDAQSNDPGRSTPLPPGISLSNLILKIAGLLGIPFGDYGILGLNYSLQSPPETYQALFPLNPNDGLQRCLNFVAATEKHNYEQNLTICRKLVDNGYVPVFGFAAEDHPPGAIGTILGMANSAAPEVLCKGLYFNLCELAGPHANIPPFRYINTMNRKLPRC